MKYFTKALGIQFGIFVAYTLIFAIFSRDGEGLLLAFWVSIIQAIIAIVLGIVILSTRKDDRKMGGLGHIVGGILVVIVGFAACFIALNNSFH